MCGIAGFVSAEAAGARAGEWRRTLERMTAAIQHRGPDGHGVFCDENAFLGHRRLSIVDLSGGAQPMANETGRRHIVYNGEVFNHAAIRPALERAGHLYTNRSDTETLLHAWEEYGAASVERFRGMFAYVIWDQDSKTLFCARDRLGIKPFYYWWDGRTFLFGSEIKALLEHPLVGARCNESVLAEYLAFGYGSGEETLFAGVRKLPPGHTLTLTLAGTKPRMEITQYWDVPAPGDQLAEDPVTEEQWTAELRRRLEETVEMRLMADVPLGMFLSGGVDSSALAALMKRMVSTPVQTFSVGYAEAQYSELGYARQVAETLGTEHHEVQVSMEDFFGHLPRLVWHEDEPICWPSSISLYFVSQLAARQVKVVLTGEGSDELFAGYERYGHYLFNLKWGRMYEAAVPAAAREAVRRITKTTGLLDGNLRRKVMHTFLGREGTLESLQLDNFYCALSDDDRAWLAPRVSGNPYASYRRHWDAREGATPLARMLYADQKTYLVELLMKQDQMSMANSIESRVPLLDHTLVEFAARIPDGLKLRGGVSKYIFKKAVGDLLPASIVHRKKMGFPTPLRAWLQDGRAKPLYDLLRRPGTIVAEYCDGKAVAALIASHQSGAVDATDRLWRLLNLQVWGEIFLSGRRKEVEESLGSLART
jgi:asparagine synthase (glutamine-hydrolysing)